MKAIVPITLLLVFALIGSTLWATSNSRQRTQCYYRTLDVSKCEQPGTFEIFVRWINGDAK